MTPSIDFPPAGTARTSIFADIRPTGWIEEVSFHTASEDGLARKFFTPAAMTQYAIQAFKRFNYFKTILLKLSTQDELGKLYSDRRISPLSHYYHCPD